MYSFFFIIIICNQRHLTTQGPKMEEPVPTLLWFTLPSSNLLDYCCINIKVTIKYIEEDREKIQLLLPLFHHDGPTNTFITVIGANDSESALFSLKSVRQCF